MFQLWLLSFSESYAPILISLLQLGQCFSTLSHPLMHSSWNTWWQWSSMQSAPSSNWSLQIAQLKITENILKWFVRVWVFIFLGMKWLHFLEIKPFRYFSNLFSQLQQLFIRHVVNIDFIFVVIIFVLSPWTSEHLVSESFEVLAELLKYERRTEWGCIVGLRDWGRI